MKSPSKATETESKKEEGNIQDSMTPSDCEFESSPSQPSQEEEDEEVSQWK